MAWYIIAGIAFAVALSLLIFIMLITLSFVYLKIISRRESL